MNRYKPVALLNSIPLLLLVLLAYSSTAFSNEHNSQREQREQKELHTLAYKDVAMEDSPFTEEESTEDVETEDGAEAVEGVDSEVDGSEDIDETSDEDVMPDLMDVSLEELLSTPVEVWSATKTEETVETAPSVVEVLTSREISLWGYRTIGELLHHMVGFYVIDDHILPNVSVRGVSGGLGSESGMIKVLVNGRSISFRATAGNWLGTELIPITAVERVEVIRGPASSLYGADAFLATVNIVLKNPKDLNGFAVRGSLGSFLDTDQLNDYNDLDRQFELVTGAQFGDFGALFAMGRNEENRSGLRLPKSSPAALLPYYNENETEASDLRNTSNVWYGEMIYERPRGSIKLSGYASTIDRAGEFSQWTQLSNGLDYNGRQNETKIALQHAILGFDGILNASEKLTLSLNFSYFTGKPGANDRVEVASDSYFVKRNYKYSGINAIFDVNWRATRRFTVVGGVEILADNETLASHDKVSKTTEEAIGTIDAQLSSRQFVNPGAYLQLHLNAVPDFIKLTGGVRADYHNIYGGQLTARAGSVFLWTDYFSTKLLYGSAFKAPSPMLLYAVPLMPGDVIGNPDLEPQYVHTFEFAPTLDISKNITVKSALAYNIILDKAEFVPEGFNITAKNVSKLQSISFETGVNMAFGNALAMYTSIEFQRVVREQGLSDYRSNLIGTKNIISPSWIVRAGASYSLPMPPKFPLRLASRVMLVSQRRASGENIVEYGRSYNVPMSAILDASLSSENLELLAIGKTTFRFRAYNLFDMDGPDPGFAGVDYPLLPRRFMLEAEQVF